MKLTESNSVNLAKPLAESAVAPGECGSVPDEKLLKKRAFQLYKKHITGRGYAWDIGCSLPDDVQRAIIEGMRQMYELGRQSGISSLSFRLNEISHRSDCDLLKPHTITANGEQYFVARNCNCKDVAVGSQEGK